MPMTIRSRPAGRLDVDEDPYDLDLSAEVDW